MPAPRSLRRLLQRLNVGLAAFLAFSAWYAVSWEPDASPPVPPQPVYEDAVLAPAAPVDGAEFDRFLAMIRVFHPGPREVGEPVAVVSTPTALPLRAFRVAMVIGREADTATVFLKSKDPALDEQFWLKGHRPHRGARVAWMRRSGDRLLVHVERGSEEFTFELHQRAGLARGGLQVPDRPASPPAPAGLRHKMRPALANHPRFREVKMLPFYGENGRVIGLRVSGVKKDSHFSRLGLRPGDVVTAAESERLAEPSSFRRRLADGWLPKSITVIRDPGAAAQTLTLRDG